uniref:Uncharacterized protein n=1 Tax=Anguilla anguilla TaxID=7936 RepID=A0A0E9Q2H3_ANGAN
MNFIFLWARGTSF